MSVALSVTWLATTENLIEGRQYAAALERIEKAGSAPADTSHYEELTLCVMEAHCRAFLGDYDTAIDLAEAIVSQTRTGIDHGLFARGCFVVAAASYYLGNIERALETINLSLFTYKRIEDTPGIARGLNWLGNIVFYKSDYPHALQAYEECARLAAQQGNMDRIRAVALGNVALVEILRGNVRVAEDHLQSVSQILGGKKEPLSRLRHNLAWVFLHLAVRRYDEAMNQLSAVFGDIEKCAGRRERGIWYEYSGELALCQERYDDATKHLQTAIGIANESGPDESLIGQSRRVLAQTYLAQGKVDLALAECERALVSIRKVGERYEEGVVDRVIGQVHSVRGEVEPARDAFRRSAGMLRMIGANLELARTGLAAGQAQVLSPRERVAYLLEAERLFVPIGVEYWSRETGIALQRLGPDDSRSRKQTGARSMQEHSPFYLTVHKPTLNTIQLAELYARESMTVLITGETGTGKDLLARRLHDTGPRRKGPFVSVNMNAIAKSVWESELFGHCKGAFTGATEDRIGLLESAKGGTVLLNEIGDLPLALQVKLLDFLDSHEIRRVGESRSRKIDAHLIAATNTDLAKAATEGDFRSDLYYRLSKGAVRLLPLRERTEDIPILIRHFLVTYEVAEKVVGEAMQQAWLERACRHSWPGNVRELQSFAWLLAKATEERTVGEWLHWADRLLDHLERRPATIEFEKKTRRVELIRSLEENDWNQRAVARELNVAESTVRSWIRRWDVNRADGNGDGDTDSQSIDDLLTDRPSHA